jgi:hypothetical protein
VRECVKHTVSLLGDFNEEYEEEISISAKLIVHVILIHVTTYSKHKHTHTCLFYNPCGDETIDSHSKSFFP